MRQHRFIWALIIFSLAPACSDGESQPSTPQRIEVKNRGIEDAKKTKAALDGGPVVDGDDAPDADMESDYDPMSLDGSVSTSIGGPSDGRLKGGVPFPKRAPGFQLNPRRLNKNSYFVTVEVLQAILKAAAVVEEVLPGGHPLFVNDACFEKGGPIPHHGSHQSGRDLDVLFYLLDREGNPRPAKGVPLDPKGQGWDFDDLAIPDDDVFVKLDAQRTWRFLQALAEQDETLLQRAFLAEHLRTILLKEARRAKAPKAARRLIEDITCQPGSPHDDHFHFRFFCTPEDIRAGCQDSPPIYPWHRAHLKTLGLRPVINRPRPTRKKSKTVSAAQALAEAGKMHWKVKAFLDERETWSERPHPGRVFCR